MKGVAWKYIPKFTIAPPIFVSIIMKQQRKQEHKQETLCSFDCSCDVLRQIMPGNMKDGWVLTLNLSGNVE
jgi:hypothetical protein